MPRGTYIIMREDERETASSFGFGDYFKGLGGRRRKRRLHLALDEGRAGLQRLKIDEWDPEALSTLASGYLQIMGAVRYFRERKAAALDTPSAVRSFLEILGRYCAEKYLRDQKHLPSPEPSLLAVTVTTEDLVGVMSAMRDAGRLATEDDEETDLSEEATPEDAAELFADALSRYESAIPPVDDDGSVPSHVQDVGIAKAAFLGLRAEELRRVVDNDGDGDESATRHMLATRLAEEYAGREDEIADIVLGEQRRDSVYGLTTRLMPLEGPPDDLAGLGERLQGLAGRYFETKPAEWFCFRRVERTGNALVITGEIVGYRVRVNEVKDEARLQPEPRREEVVIRLRDGINWAETNVRQTSALASVRRVLRRTELARPKPSLTPPAPVEGDPLSRCDPRTLWMLELLYRELSATPFSVNDHLMVNFHRPPQPDAGSDADTPRPTVNAVRLKGMLLIDHPEVCDLILRGRRIVDIELALRVKQPGTDDAYSPVLKVKLGWADDHLTISTGDLNGSYDHNVHNRLIRDVRQAAPREVSPTYIALPMQRIQSNAGRRETDDLPSVLQHSDPAAENA